MDELVAAHGFSHLTNDACAFSLLKQVEQTIDGQITSPLQRIQTKLSARDGGDVEQAVAVIAEPRQAPADQISHPFRNVEDDPKIGCDVPIPLTESARLGEVVVDLLDEQGVAFRMPVDRPAQVNITVPASQRGDQASDFILVQPTQRHIRHRCLLSQVHEQLVEWMRPTHLVLRIGSYDEERRLLERVEHVP